MAKRRTNTLSDAMIADVREMREQTLGRKPGNTTTPYGARSAELWYAIEITVATRDDANWRWTYTGRVQKKTSAGFGGWEDYSNVNVTAYNFVEKDNGASGTVSGITLDAKVIGIKPIPIGQTVWARKVLTSAGSEFWFSLPNAPEIDCDGEATSGGA
jgi:hypothetical protein